MKSQEEHRLQLKLQAMFLYTPLVIAGLTAVNQSVIVLSVYPHKQGKKKIWVNACFFKIFVAFLPKGSSRKLSAYPPTIL